MPFVTSKDGTRIGYESMGSGPAIILVDGALCYRGSGPALPLAHELKDRFTVTVYDRRGRGESGDAQPYAVEREIEPEWKTVQTFAVEGMYDGQYSIETLTLEEVDGKTVYKVHSELPDVAARDGMLASGMEVGVVEGFERLDAILVELSAS